jgi:hypothetical protein
VHGVDRIERLAVQGVELGHSEDIGFGQFGNSSQLGLSDSAVRKYLKKYPIGFADFLFEISQVGVSSEYSPKRWDSAILPEPMFHQPRIYPCPTRPRPPKATVPQGV